MTMAPCPAVRTAAAARGEGGVVGHGLVGRRDHQHRVSAALQRLQRGQGHGGAVLRPIGSSTTADGSIDNLAQLVQHQEAVLLIANHQRALHR
jgi:hypothetical protein